MELTIGEHYQLPEKLLEKYCLCLARLGKRVVPLKCNFAIQELNRKDNTK
jgi:hypothetical protein